ncbi:nuclear distribution protein nudE homolog [Aethina tumida]|uniref:nuclear distribution protein nudE homolog n=1 Tax=Aethina tumida TaxID=116153 RepID=UPI00096B4B5C|nr:nuclear distribution protein nudE homolog [Aethina tumida]XP_049826306.1 nuclear distribution protein nudE homolog [Aethina tumida]XP_049826307.1 nuclear distribution protein nudE homolog [Aethina tumida]
MNLAELSKFSDKHSESQFLKIMSHEYQEQIFKLQQELDEFVTESRQLEREYEITIEQNEKKINELILKTNSMQNEIDSYKAKLEESNEIQLKLKNENLLVTESNRELKELIRGLEQINDKWETSHRILEKTVNDIETAFNTAIERNALLELEVDEKDSLKEQFQRLLDEKIELFQDLKAKEKHTRKLKGAAPQPPKLIEVKDAESQTSPKRKIKFKMFRTLYTFCRK